MWFLFDNVFRFLVRILILPCWRLTTRWLRAALTPSYRFGLRDQHLERVSQVLRYAALAIFVFVTLRWKVHEVGWLEQSINGEFTELVVSAALTGGLMLLPCALLIVLAPRGSRGVLFGYLCTPLGRVLGSIIVVAITVVLADVSTRTPPTAVGLAPALLELCWVVALLELVVAMFAMVFVGLRLAINNMFCAVDGHPTLPALTSMTVHAAMLAVAIDTICAGGTDPATPYLAAVAFSLGGPLSALGCGGYELWRLKRYFGVGLRWPVPTPRPAPVGPD